LAQAGPNSDPEAIHPLCLWDVANTISNGTPVAHHPLAACVRDYSNISVREIRGSFIADSPNNESDEVSAELLGRGPQREQIYKLSESCCYDKIGGTIVVSVKQEILEHDVVNFSMRRIYYGGYRAQGAISRVTVAPGEGVLVDVSFDSTWGGMPDDELSRLPPMGSGCGSCGLGIAHVMVSFDGKDSRVNSIEVYEPDEPTEYSCNQIAMKNLINSFPHTFSRLEMLRLGEEIRKVCPGK
jgi:hypothetical protein